MWQLKCQNYCIVRWLVTAEAEDLNRNIVEFLGLTLYSYELWHDNYLMHHFIHVRDVTRPSKVIVDPYLFRSDSNQSPGLFKHPDQIWRLH